MQNTSTSCCPWMKGFIGFAVAGAIAWGGFSIGRQSTHSGLTITPQMLNASGAVTSEEFSAATGSVGESEALFVLDHATGMLQGYVLYPRTGKFGAVYQGNISELLPGRGEKGSKYMLITGNANFPGRGAAGGAANTVVYAINITSGSFVALGLAFDRTAVNSGRQQTGSFIPLDVGQARQMAVRE